MGNELAVSNFDIDMDNEFPLSGEVLYAKLEVTKDYTSWMKDQIKRGQLVEGVDFLVYTQKGENSKRGRKEGRPSSKWTFTIDASKHICLLSGTAKGRECRQELIDLHNAVMARKFGSVGHLSKRAAVETLALAEAALNVYLNIGTRFRIPEHVLHIEASKRVKSEFGVDFAPLLLFSPLQDNIASDEMMLEPTEIAKELGLQSAQTVNKWLVSLGYQNKKGELWVPTEKGRPYCSKHAWTVGPKSGYNLKWRLEHLQGLYKQALQEG